MRGQRSAQEVERRGHGKIRGIRDGGHDRAAAHEFRCAARDRLLDSREGTRIGGARLAEALLEPADPRPQLPSVRGHHLIKAAKEWLENRHRVRTIARPANARGWRRIPECSKIPVWLPVACRTGENSTRLLDAISGKGGLGVAEIPKCVPPALVQQRDISTMRKQEPRHLG